MQTHEWPAGDQKWVAQYRMALARESVPAEVREARERELLEAVRESGQPASEAFGEADAVAADDAAELSTPGEAVRVSVGGGLRPALREVGGTLLGIGVVAVVLLALRSGWTVDLEAAELVVAGSLVVAYLGWVVGRALFAGGRAAATVATVVGAGAIAVLGIIAAVQIGPDVVVAAGVSVPLIAVLIVVSGVAILVATRWMPEHTLRDSWDNDEWLRRFSGGLRARLMTGDAVRSHVAEVTQAISAGGGDAFEEFGHPVALARAVAESDRVARRRRWWVAMVVGAVFPLVIAAMIVVNDSWGALTIPAAVFLGLGALATLGTRWATRPGTAGR